MKVKIFLAYCFLHLLFCTGMRAQDLLPFVENFTKSDYTGDNQVWSVVQGNDNAMYYANNHYFLRYNGVKWEKYSLPNKTIIRSVFSDGDKIYCGSYREFGYWKRVRGVMKYYSVSSAKNIFTGAADNEEIWKIFRHRKKIYFQSFNALYVYDGNAVEKVSFPSLVSYCYLINNTVYAATVINGIYKMHEDKFEKVPGWNHLEGNVIHGMQAANDDIYIFTKNNGIYRGNESRVTEWNTPLNGILKENVILCSKLINSETLAVGSALQGLFIIDIKTGNYKNINRQNTLKNNAVLSLALDNEKDLWLGLDNGISHIEVNSPVSVFFDSSGILGSVYALSPIDSGYLFATNHGVFKYNNKLLTAVPNSQGQVWDIYKNGTEYIIGHNDGTFIYDRNSFNKVTPINGGWRFMYSRFDDAYFQVHYAGISVYKNINNLSNYKSLDSINKPFKNIAQNKPSEIWAADNYRGLYRISYDNDFNVTRRENISEENGITNDYGVKIFKFRDEILFFINNTWYTYNSISGSLETNSIFNASFRDISDIIPIDDESFMISKSGQLFIINRSGQNFQWKLMSEKYYLGRLIMEDTRVFKDKESLLINLDDGFLAYSSINNKKRKAKIYIEAFNEGILVKENPKIKHNQPLELQVISNYFGYNRPDLFYRLNGSEEYIPIKNGYVILNNLSSGTQNFEVFYNDGENYVKAAVYNFEVARPWYFSIWMITVYLFIIFTVFFLYYRWNKVRYLQKIRLNEEELKHRREILELEMEAESKLRQQEYEKHILETEVQNKASEVAGKSLSIAKHSEMIESIQEVLEGNTEAEELKSKIRKVIKSSTLSKNEWQSFEKNLIKSHEEFVDRLSKKYPTLTSKDIKLSIYLKMNLSSKEIAPLMNISYRGVELHRYRLRKKLDINPDESLSMFMINI